MKQQILFDNESRSYSHWGMFCNPSQPVFIVPKGFEVDLEEYGREYFKPSGMIVMRPIKE